MKQLLLLPFLFITVISFGQSNNYSLEFDGTNDYVELSNDYDYPSKTISLSVNVVSYPVSSSIGMLYMATNSMNIYGLNQITLKPDGSIGYQIGSNSGQSSNIMPLNEWINITLTIDALYAKLYVNGTIDDSVSFSNTAGTNTLDNITFGCFKTQATTNRFFNGLLDDICVWNIGLDSNQIQQYMNCPPIGNEAGLVGYWNFEAHEADSYEYGAECFDGIDNNFDANLDAGDPDCQTIIELDWTSNQNNGIVIGGMYSTDVPPYNCCALNPIVSQPTDQSTTIGNNATISFTDNLTGATYQWQIDAGTGYSNLSNAGQFSGTDTQTLTISTTTMSNNNTLYRCIVTESSNCMDTTDVSTLTVIDNTSITENGLSNLTIYPNPTSDQITIDIKGYNGNVNIEVYDLQGRLLETTTNTTVSLKKHAKGIYVLKVSYGEITEEVRVVRD